MRPSSSRITHAAELQVYVRQSEAEEKSKFSKAITPLLLAAPHPMSSSLLMSDISPSDMEHSNTITPSAYGERLHAVRLRL